MGDSNVKKIIAITQRVVEAESYADRRDCLSQDWFTHFEAIFPSITLIPIPNCLLDPVGWFKCVGATGLILSNGNDVGTAVDRDKTENELFTFALEKDIPVLGACRGLQVANVFLGGEIYDGEESYSDHVAKHHKIRLVDKEFVEIAGDVELTVNSFHRQTVRLSGLSKYLKPFALHGEDIVEGAVHRHKPLLLLQWHIERVSPSQEFDTKLLNRFLENRKFWGEE